MAVMEDGFSTTIAFSGLVEATFCAKTVTPPALIMGGANDVSCMSNTQYRTTASKKLIALGDVTAVGYYNASLYNSFISVLGLNQSITVQFPPVAGETTGGSLQFFGFLDSFTPGASEEGGAPEATIVLVITNRDPADGTESAPVFTAGT